MTSSARHEATVEVTACNSRTDKYLGLDAIESAVARKGSLRGTEVVEAASVETPLFEKQREKLRGC